jgi:hypothetical protein
MPAISRRRFLRDASLGAAAVGAIAAVGPSALSLATASSAAAAPVTSHEQSVASSPSPETEVIAHVVDRSSGTISIYSGTQKVTFQNRAVTETLLKALR